MILAGLKTIVANLVGLIVDDGLIAGGGILALVVTGLLAGLELPLLGPYLGLVLFLLVAVILLVSLFRAAREARHD